LEEVAQVTTETVLVYFLCSIMPDNKKTSILIIYTGVPLACTGSGNGALKLFRFDNILEERA